MSEARCWPRLGAGTLRPLTLPSHVNTCSSPSRLPQQRDEHADRRQVRRDADASDASTAPASGGQRRLVDRQPLGVERRLDHLQALQAVALEPLRDDRDHVPARLDAGADRIDQRLALFLGRRLEERVDAALAVDQTAPA